MAARTAKQKAALRKAQLASARKRKGKGRGKLAKANRSNSRLKKAAKYTAIGVGVAAAAGAAGYAAHKNSQRHNKRMNMHAHKTDYGINAGHFNNSMGKVNFGLSRKQRAGAKAAGAAHGSSGSHKRIFVGHPPAKKSKAKYHQESRLRQHTKAGERGLYNAGLGSHGTRSIALGSGKKKRKRR